jgi:hypothetical protein
MILLGRELTHLGNDISDDSIRLVFKLEKKKKLQNQTLEFWSYTRRKETSLQPLVFCNSPTGARPKFVRSNCKAKCESIRCVRVKKTRFYVNRNARRVMSQHVKLSKIKQSVSFSWCQF